MLDTVVDRRSKFASRQSMLVKNAHVGWKCRADQINRDEDSAFLAIADARDLILLQADFRSQIIGEYKTTIRRQDSNASQIFCCHAEPASIESVSSKIRGPPACFRSCDPRNCAAG